MKRLALLALVLNGCLAGVVIVDGATPVSEFDVVAGGVESGGAWFRDASVTDSVFLLRHSNP